MKSLLILILIVMSVSVNALAAGPSGDIAARITALGGRIDTMAAGKPGEYAREMLELARTSSLAAQYAFTAGNDGTAQQKLELADMQLTVAEAKSAEKDLAEETAVRRAELTKLEAQLERYLQGEDQ